jgi:Ca2+/Na+ antiporter
MPLTTDQATVYACVTLKDDQGKKIVRYNGPVGKIQIDPLTVRVGEADKACVPSEKVFNVPLQLVNARSQQPATTDASVRWITRLVSPSEGIQPGSTIDEIDAQTGEYALHFQPALPGDVSFAVWADAIVDYGSNIFYGKEIIPIRVDPPRRLALTLAEPETLGDWLSVTFFKWFRPSCIDDDTQIVIGRRFFGLSPTSVQIKGRFIDLGSNLNEPGIEDFTVQLLSLDGGSSSETLNSWTVPANSDDYSTLEIPPPGLGLYNVAVTDQGKDLECTVREDLPTQTILLINDFWEYLILLIMILFLALLVIYLLRRYRNRRYSHEIPLILASVVLIALNLILVNLLFNHTFECQFNCDFLIDHTLNTDTLCSQGLGLPIKPFDLFPGFSIGPITIYFPWPPWHINIGPFRIPSLTIPANLIPFLPPFKALDPPLEVLRQQIARIIIVFIALASLVTALILKRLLTPEGRKTILTYFGLWLLFFVIFCSLFYFRVVK